MAIARRRWLVMALAGVAWNGRGMWEIARPTLAAESPAPTEKTTRVKSVLEVKGQVKLKNHRAKAGDAERSAPIEAKSTLEYEEAFRVQRGTPSSDDMAYQIYHTAELDNQIEKHPTKLSLRETCRELVRTSVDGKQTTNCIEQPLTAAERDLVEGPIETMYLDQLLPQRAIKLGDAWELENEVAAALLRLDLVTSGKFKVTLVDSDESTAQLTLAATIEGEVRNVSTKIQVEGTAKVDRSSGIVTWCAASINENRSVGEWEPGFSIQARLRILREKTLGLSNGQTLASAQKRFDQSTATRLTQFDSRLGAYRFVADRDWTIYNDTAVDATLRWVRKNRAVAHCTITNLTDTEPGRKLSIEGFQNDIQKSLGKRFGQFLEADERVSPMGLRMMRVVTMGQVEGVAVQWIHILLSNDGGRHLSLAYSMNASSVETFATNDLQMADSLEFTLKQLPVAPSDPKSDTTTQPTETKSAAKPATAR